MSAQNQISVTIPEATITTILENLQECKTLLEPFFQGLKEASTKGIPSAGPIYADLKQQYSKRNKTTTSPS